MAQKLSITIPDGLFDRLQKVKSLFNVSGACQAAIDREVTLQELYEKGSEMNMERLRMEKEEYNKEFFDEGHKDALETDGPNMSYGDLASVVQDERDSDVCGETISELEYNRDDYHGGVFDVDSYMNGWVEGIKEFFEQVKAEL